jgi:hypothetical protein
MTEVSKLSANTRKRALHSKSNPDDVECIQRDRYLDQAGSDSHGVDDID